MKACIILQNQYAKLGHAVALNLKEKHGVDKFCAYLFSPLAENFIKNQTEIKYEPLLMDHELHEKYKQEKIDFSFIKYFEKEYGPPNLWTYLYSDRKLMMSMGPKEETTIEIDPLYSHKNLLKIFQARAKVIEKFLNEAKPDFILFFSLGALGHMIIYHIAKKMNISTFNLDFARIGNRVCLSRDYKKITDIKEQKQEEGLLTEINYERERGLLAEFRRTGSLHLEGFETYEKIMNSRVPITKKSLQTVKYYCFTLLINYFKNRKIFIYGNTAANPLLAIYYKLKEKYRQIIGLADLYSEPNSEEDYAFYPLHLEPELSILLLSPFYFDQISLIRQIARSLPLHYKFYIKDHPAMIHKRSKKYYKNLLKIPNVKLIDPKLKSFDIIKKAKLVTTITGTVGWEASLLGKPVITFGDVFYNDLSFVEKIKNMEDLPQLIRRQIDDFHYDENELLRFMKALLDNSVPMNFAGLWFVDDWQKLKNDLGVKQFCELLMKKVRRD